MAASRETALYIVLLGPPGVGKGTQAEILAKEISLPHVSSGELFRENMRNRTELGRQVQGYMDSGNLVPDALTIAMVDERLSRADCKSGAILDGFPRTPEQADALKNMLHKYGADVDLVPFITAATDILVERICGRWTCKAAGHVYHEKFSPPKTPGKCDIDGSGLYQRADDQSETVAKRIQVYLEQTAPLVEYYTAKGKLIEVDGAQPIEQVTRTLLASIKRLQA